MVVLLDRLLGLPFWVLASQNRIEQDSFAIRVSADSDLHVSLAGLPDELPEPRRVVSCLVVSRITGAVHTFQAQESRQKLNN